MSPEELSWLAGIIEGEGCFGTFKRHGLLRVVMTDRDIIERLLAVSGVGVVSALTKRAAHHRTPYAWTVARAENVRDCILHVSPLLGERRRAAAAVILQRHGVALPTSREMIPQSPEAWAWISALIEGEGHIHPGPLTRDQRPRISVESTDLDIVIRLASLTGAGTLMSRGVRNGLKPTTRWTVAKRAHVHLILKHGLMYFGDRRGERASYALAKLGSL